MVRNRLEISPPPPLFAPEPSPFTFYLLPFTFYLFPFSFFLFPFTYYPLPFILYPLCLMPYALCLVPCALCFINLYALCLVLPPGPSYLILRLPFFVPYPLPFYLPQSSLTPDPRFLSPVSFVLRPLSLAAGLPTIACCIPLLVHIHRPVRPSGSVRRIIVCGPADEIPENPTAIPGNSHKALPTALPSATPFSTSAREARAGYASAGAVPPLQRAAPACAVI